MEIHFLVMNKSWKSMENHCWKRVVTLKKTEKYWNYPRP